jgi:Cytidylate kinase-like family/BON domain
MGIVTLSRELGSLGTRVADALSSTLGFSRLDKESLEVLLRELGMTEPRFDGDDEKRPGFWESFTLQKEKYLAFMKAAMYRFAAEKDCIIVGRGANIIFWGVPGTLRLRIIAPPKVRVARLCERLCIDEQHALRMTHQSDHDRAGYHRYFFNSTWDSPQDYDLVMNTAAISPEEICETVSALLHSPAFSGAGQRARDALQDMLIAQDVIIAILYRERIPAMSLNVVCKQGVVSLHGVVRLSAAMDRCAQLAGTVKGVTSVVSYMEVADYAQYYPGM